MCTYCIKNQLLYWFFQETVSKFSLFINLAFLNFCLMMTKKHTLYSSKFNNYFLSKLLPIKSWNSSLFFPPWILVISLFCKQYKCLTVSKSFFLQVELKPFHIYRLTFNVKWIIAKGFSRTNTPQSDWFSCFWIPWWL